MKMWRATRYTVEEVEVEHKTAAFVQRPGRARREKIDTSYEHWRDTKEAAVDAVIADLRSDVAAAEAAFIYRQDKLAEYIKKHKTA